MIRIKDTQHGGGIGRWVFVWVARAAWVIKIQSENTHGDRKFICTDKKTDRQIVHPPKPTRPLDPPQHC